jgi:hypothetical protein
MQQPIVKPMLALTKMYDVSNAGLLQKTRNT